MALRTYSVPTEDGVGISQAELARRAGEDPGWLSKLESGQTNPTWARLKRLLRAMDLDIVDLAKEEHRQEHGD